MEKEENSMGDLTGRLMKLAAQNHQDAGSPVQDAYEEILHGDSKEAGLKIANLTQEEVRQLQAQLAKHGEKSPEMPTHGTVENPKSEVRKEVPEEKASTEARPAKEDEDVKLGKGLGKGDGGSSTPAAAKPGTISELLSPSIDETTRTPNGGGDTKDDLKTAEFKAGWVDGIKGVMHELSDLVAKHAQLDLKQHFGDAYAKVASKAGEEEAMTALQESFAEGQKLAMKELQENKEVEMGSLKKLAEDQEKIASVDDLREFGRRLGRESLLTKIAEDQKKHAQEMEEAPVEEAPVEAGGDAGLEEAAEAAAIVDAIAEKAMTSPETMTPEEAEVLLQVGDAVEDSEAEVVGEEKVTKITDIAAALRQYGYGEASDGE
jgi:hypothetical protein